MKGPLDVVSFGETMLRFTVPPGARLERAQDYSAYVGGSESNVLACLARLGLSCSWLSGLPANPLGWRVATELRGYGVDVSGVVWMEGARLGIFFAEESAAPLGHQIYYDRANSACAQIDPDAVDLSLIHRARLVHLSGITPALGGGAHQVFDRILRETQEHGIPLSFDVNYRSRLWPAARAAETLTPVCRAATIFFCTRGDAAELWGLTGAPEEILRGLAERFDSRRAEKRLVLTLGDEGSMQMQGGEISHVPAYPAAGPYRIGSGDAFAAGYLYAYLAGPLWPQLRERGATPLHAGNALAALKRAIAGDMALVMPEEVLTVVQGEEGRFR